MDRLSDLIDSYLSALKIEKGASPHTCNAYVTDLNQVSKFLILRNKNLLSAKTNDIEEWLEEMSLNKISARSKQRKLSSIRGLFRFCMEEGIRKDDPTENIKINNVHNPLPKTLEKEEIEALIKAVKKQKSYLRYRLIAILELLYATGMRISECVSLPIYAINKEAPVLRIVGKGQKHRQVPMTPVASYALVVYLNYRHKYLPVGQESDFVFPSKSKKGHISRQHIFQLLKQLAVDAGIDSKRVSPHILRHAFASHLLESGGDLRFVQELLGHQDISTTQIYTHISDVAAKKMIKEIHPLSNDNLE